LNGGGRVNGERVGIHLQDGRAVRQKFTAALDVVREDPGKLLCDHVEVALVLDGRVICQIVLCVAEVHETDLFEFP
jgi:hypothetical protein